VQIPVGNTCGIGVSAIVGNPQLIAPAAFAYHSSVTLPRARTNAYVRSLLYMRFLLKSPGLMPPKAMATRHAKPMANTAWYISGPNGTSLVGQPIWTPVSASCSEILFPSFSPHMKT